jgi:hypothetical protein
MAVLGQLVDVLGALGACQTVGPVDRDAALHTLVLHDPADQHSPKPGDIVLAVGLDTPEAVAALVNQGGAGVIVLRGRPPLDERVTAAAHASGTPVVLVDPDISWGQLAGVVHTVVLGEPEKGGLFAVSDSIAAAVGRPVTIEDVQGRVLAYSHRQHDVDQARLQTILGRQVPEQVLDTLRAHGVFTHLATSDEPLFVPVLTDDLTSRVVVAVRAGSTLLGSIWVEVDRPLPPAQHAALVAGARTASTQLLRARASADLERRAEAELVTSLLDGVADAPTILARLGLPSTGLRVIAVRGTVGPDSALVALQHATAQLAWSRPGRSALIGEVLYTVLPCDGDAKAALDWVAALPPELNVRAGIGGPATAEEVPASRAEAEESLAVGDRSHPAVYDDVWDKVLLRRLTTAALMGRAPARGPAVDLLRHDVEHGTEYGPTLRAWLEAQGDTRAAAARLRVHPNTVRYRLQKMAEVSPLDLHDPDIRLALIIALSVHAAAVHLRPQGSHMNRAPLFDPHKDGGAG